MSSDKKTVMHKITAVGFIIVTLAGNFWLMYMLLGNDAPKLVVRSFETGLILTAIGGLGMLTNYLVKLFYNRQNGQNS